MNRMNTQKKCGVLKSESGIVSGDGCCDSGNSGRSTEKGKGDRVKKFFKNKKIMGSLITVVLLGFGVPHAGIIVPIATDAYCEQVKCDA